MSLIPRKDIDKLIDINLKQIYYSEKDSFAQEDLIDEQKGPLKHPERLLEELELKLLVEPARDRQYVLSEYAHKIMQKGGWLHLVSQLKEPSSPSDYGRVFKEELIESLKSKKDKKTSIAPMLAVAITLLVISIIVVILMGVLAKKGFEKPSKPETKKEHLENRLKQLEDSLERVRESR